VIFGVRPLFCLLRRKLLIFRPFGIRLKILLNLKSSDQSKNVKEEIFMVTLSLLQDAILFLSSDMPYANQAVLNKKTGEIFYRSDFGDIDEFPEDVESDEYIFLPHKKELGIDASTALNFAAEYIPDQYEKVQYIFSRRGAYRWFKDLLTSLGMLEKWYAYEEEKTNEALLRWCEENDIEVDPEE
jgi:hypothetical protein